MSAHLQSYQLTPDEKERLKSLPDSGLELEALTLEWASYVLGIPDDIVAAYALPDHASHLVPDYLEACRTVEIPMATIEEMSQFKASFLQKHRECKQPGCACETIRHYSQEKPAQ